MAMTGKLKKAIVAGLTALGLAIVGLFAGIHFIGGDNNQCGPGAVCGGRNNRVNVNQAPDTAKPITEPRARYSGDTEPIEDNANPKKTGCDSDATTVDIVQIATQHDELLGDAELRYSKHCHAEWGRFTPSDRLLYLRDSKAIIYITAERAATHTIGKTYTVKFDGQAAFGDMLLDEHSCVKVTVIVRTSSGYGQATTHCMS